MDYGQDIQPSCSRDTNDDADDNVVDGHSHHQHTDGQQELKALGLTVFNHSDYEQNLINQIAQAIKAEELQLEKSKVQSQLQNIQQTIR